MHQINTQENKDKKFWIHPDDFQKIIDYASASYQEFKAEIAGQLIVETDDEGDFILKFPEIMKQDVSGGECTLDAEELARYYSKSAAKYGRNVRFCWWHSHHTMGAFWSGTDNATILGMPAEDWSLSLVINLKKEYKLRVQFFKPFLHEENVELNFLEVETSVNQAVMKEVKEKCTSAIVNYGTGYKQGHLALTPAENTWAAADYNGYGYEYGGYNKAPYNTKHSSYYNSHTQKYTDLSSVPEKVIEEAELFVISLVEEVGRCKNAKVAFRKWNEKIKKPNIAFKKHDFKISKFKDEEALSSALQVYWDDDFFENVNQEEEVPF